MKNKTIWVIVSCLMVAGLLLASCAPAAPTTEKPAAPTTEKPAAPTTEKPAAPTTVLTEEPKYGGTLHYVAETSGTTGLVRFDPYRYEPDTHFIVGFVYEKLVMGDWGMDRKVFDFPAIWGMLPWKYNKGALLQSWEQPDPLTLTCHVRQGVRWQNKPPLNGREFTAADAVWQIDTSRADPFIGHPDDQYIESTRVLDKYTFEIKFKPPPMFEHIRVLDTTWWNFNAKESVGKSASIEDWRLMIGTGPFMG